MVCTSFIEYISTCYVGHAMQDVCCLLYCQPIIHRPMSGNWSATLVCLQVQHVDIMQGDFRQLLAGMHQRFDILVSICLIGSTCSVVDAVSARHCGLCFLVEVSNRPFGNRKGHSVTTISRSYSSLTCTAVPSNHIVKFWSRSKWPLHASSVCISRHRVCWPAGGPDCHTYLASEVCFHLIFNAAYICVFSMLCSPTLSFKVEPSNWSISGVHSYILCWHWATSISTEP